MENYIHIPATVKAPTNMNIAGGTITKIDTTNNGSAYIASKATLN